MFACFKGFWHRCWSGLSVDIHSALLLLHPLFFYTHTDTLFLLPQDLQLAQIYLHTHKCLLTAGLKEREKQGNRSERGRGWRKPRREGVMRQKLRGSWSEQRDRWEEEKLLKEEKRREEKGMRSIQYDKTEERTGGETAGRKSGLKESNKVRRKNERLWWEEER